ncbi:hypothetical protein MKY04_18205 [Lysinibacillus telephonicus]|uniref:hypothetical protein n=1 Tax=Lysinibacillus telephonicus TaxID=1714840 RepID=UPI0031FC7DC2
MLLGFITIAVCLTSTLLLSPLFVLGFKTKSNVVLYSSFFGVLAILSMACGFLAGIHA